MRELLKKPVTTGNVKNINFTTTDMKHKDTEGIRRVLLGIRDITDIAVGNEETVEVTKNKEDDHQNLPRGNDDGGAERTVMIQNIADVRVTPIDTEQAMTIISTRVAAE